MVLININTFIFYIFEILFKKAILYLINLEEHAIFSLTINNIQYMCNFMYIYKLCIYIFIKYLFYSNLANNLACSIRSYIEAGSTWKSWKSCDKC